MHSYIHTYHLQVHSCIYHLHACSDVDELVRDNTADVRTTKNVYLSVNDDIYRDVDLMSMCVL